jgi:hypothetical protein
MVMRHSFLMGFAAIGLACLALETALPSAAAQVPGPRGTTAAEAEPAYPTANGPRTAPDLQRELTAAGYTGPWDIASMLDEYGRAAQPRIDPYPSDLAWSCLSANSSCSSAPWWAEQNTLQDDTRITYTAVGSGFSTERRFAEAVNLLWQWPEGKTLLREADHQAVSVITLDYDVQTAYASYIPERNVITVNRRYVTAPTWMVAGVLAHELSHALDDGRNSLEQGSADCLARETRAFEVERRYLGWLTRTLQPDGLPSLTVVSARLSADHAQLAADLYEVGGSSNLARLTEREYGKTCGLTEPNTQQPRASSGSTVAFSSHSDRLQAAPTTGSVGNASAVMELDDLWMYTR